MMIAAYAIQAKQAFIYIRAEFFEGARILERAIAEAKENGFCGEKIWARTIRAIWSFIAEQVPTFVAKKPG